MSKNALLLIFGKYIRANIMAYLSGRQELFCNIELYC